MADPNLRDFYGRIRRIEKIHRRGGGFEAAGTLGRSYYTQYSKRSRSPVLRPVLLILVAIICLKGVIHQQVGAASYDQRVEGLQTGGTVDQIGAFLMQADPVTVFVSNQIRDLKG